MDVREALRLYGLQEPFTAADVLERERSLAAGPETEEAGRILLATIGLPDRASTRAILEYFDRAIAGQGEKRRKELEAARSTLLRRVMSDRPEVPFPPPVDPAPPTSAHRPRSRARRLVAVFGPFLLLAIVVGGIRACARRTVYGSVDEYIRDEAHRRKLRGERLMSLDPATYRFGTPRDTFRQASDALRAPMRNAIRAWGGPSAGDLSIQEKVLNFCGKESRLLYVIDHGSEPPVRQLILVFDGKLHEVAWSGAAVQMLNEATSFKASQCNVADYLRFCFSVIRFQGGRLLLIEKVDDVRWRNEAGEDVRTSVRALVRPLEVREGPDRGQWVGTGHFVLGNALLRTEVVLRPDGDFIFRNEQWLLRDLPVQPDIREVRDSR